LEKLVHKVYERPVSPEDVNVARSTMPLAPARSFSLEELGFCKTGEGGPMSGREHGDYRQDSINTDGGLLSARAIPSAPREAP